MSTYSDLWHVIISRVADVRGIAHSSIGFKNYNNADTVKLYLRSAQIFTLELILHIHRSKYGTKFEPLSGIKALHHLIFMKTKWRIEDIEKMSLNHCLLVLQEDIRIDKLPADAQEYLSYLPDYSLTFDGFLDNEWAPGESSAFLHDIQVDNHL
ncbi:hypothetical protein I2494_07720 [Budviciaceae bacterium BWR-B9]|uniref:Uncharacterized protein n=2 Tax=Limnobaculum TaxID=2172100 RepID=A0A9D7AGF5_9GAMM|nr:MULTISPECIES: hypothetical protein [Limnobaculum]MBK5072215.1 hypothetical protein [Limnobaculum xujianqingii]MBK5143600.1 hypothetical protein [Limnobaculum allomyrinae]MBK5175524.1 hypothetical protein [Limnobaculum xujianqingii]MBV7691490.1 hypothetical protein [Limnobaculum sp. M2-1]